jgi:hypothetical protein
MNKLENLEIGKFSSISDHNSLVISIPIWNSYDTFSYVLPSLLFCKHFDIFKQHSNYFFWEQKFVLCWFVTIFLTFYFPLYKPSVVRNDFVKNVVLTFEILNPFFIIFATKGSGHLAKCSFGIFSRLEVAVCSKKSVFLS